MSEKPLMTNVAVMVVAVVVVIMAVTMPTLLVVYQQAGAFRAEDGSRLTTIVQKAPVIISGDNIYVV